MTSPWAWLMLFAMAAASTPHLPLVDAIDFYADRFTDDRDNGSSRINKNDYNNDKEGTRSYTCPDPCECKFQPYKSTGLTRSLLTVNCSGRGLIEFPEGLPDKTEVLDMSHNKLQNLTSLPRLVDLRVLDMSGNWMRHLDNHWVFEHVSKLRVLSLADNALQILQHGSFSGLGELRDLDLSKNIIKRIELHSFGGLNNLEVLRLDNNELYQLKREWFLALSSLTTLHLAQNLVSTLTSNLFSSLSHLQHLDLSHNALQVLSGEALLGLNKLKLLNLSGNSNLQDVPTDAVQLLSTLNILLLDGIAVQKLRSFSVTYLGVAELSLSFLPRLRVVEKSAFHNLSNLRTLQLHDNPSLVFVHPSAFSNLPSLRHLLLHNNGLIAISSQIMTSLPSLTDLHLYHNPLHCDCNIYWIRKELSRVFHNEYRTNAHSSLESIFASPSSNITTEANDTSSTNSTTTVTSSSNKNISITLTFISEPDRVSCFFPMDKSSMPLIQLPLQYFSPTCPPKTLPLFPAFINVSLGEELWLECQGLGVPIPDVTWILPDGREVNLTNFSELSSGSDNAEKPAKVAEENLLYIKTVTKSDSGSYGCRAVNSIGEDFSSTIVHVQNKPLALSDVTVSNDYITVSWRGSIPRIQMSDFQLYYRDIFSHEQTDSVDGIDSAEEKPSQSLSETTTNGVYDVIFLHGSIHKCTITGLQPQTTYEVCLVYRQTHLIQCNNYTTTHNVHVVRADGIVRVSKAQVGVGVASVLGVLLLVLTIFLIRRVKHRKDYHDPLAEEEKASIPLEGLVPTAPSTPLTTSRTALLTNSQI